MIRRSGLAALPIALALLVCCGAPTRAWAADNCAGGGGPRPDEGGIGGTGVLPGGGEEDDSGVGGTGARPGGADDDSGVGGTGISAGGDTGVIGTVTGFASICVGEIEIHYDAGAVVHVDGQPATPAQLAVGQVVEVVAAGSGSELDARQISVRHIVVGPVSGAAAEGNELGVIGQTVRLTPRTRGDEAADDRALGAAEFPIGTMVQVSGLRQADGSIVASRVTRTSDEIVRLAGAVQAAADGQATIAGTPVRLATGMELVVGEEVRVSGGWRGDHLAISTVERVPHLPFDGSVARVEVEGYASLATPEQLRVGPYRFEVSRGALAALPEPGSARPVRIEAVIRDRRAIVERVDAAPELPPRPAPRDGGREWHGAGGGPPQDRSAREGRPPGYEGRSDRPPGGRHEAGIAPPDRPERPERPSGPERPPHIERPALPDRPELPSRPERPPRPGGP
jgi:hypothetical protein